MYVYRSSREKDGSGYVRMIYTTGFYKPDGGWEGDKDFSDSEEAAQRVHYLNGGISNG